MGGNGRGRGAEWAAALASGLPAWHALEHGSLRAARMAHCFVAAWPPSCGPERRGMQGEVGAEQPHLSLLLGGTTDLGAIADQLRRHRDWGRQGGAIEAAAGVWHTTSPSGACGTTAAAGARRRVAGSPAVLTALHWEPLGSLQLAMIRAFIWLSCAASCWGVYVLALHSGMAAASMGQAPCY